MKERISKSLLSSALSVFTVVLFLIPAASVLAEKNETVRDELLTRIENRYAGADFTAAFEQISRLKALDMNEKASGQAYFSHPGKMKWAYTAPTEHRIITDGTTLWIYRPDQHQVVTGDAEKFFKSGAGGAFLSNISLVREKYTIEIKENAKDHALLEFTPKVPRPEIASITIDVMKDTFHIKKVVTTNAYGDITELVFSDIKFKDLDSGMFEFEIPEDVDVIRMDE
ncbi:MAG: outer membrane lipoprotein carrier protein LolA [Desulfarculaceae bacterium]|nr:outer membrane lipoprotein carrier protein LolA [Desulfarculaceae bacterium]